MQGRDYTKKVVAIYCRVSTKEQAEEGYSISEQERLLLEYCEKNQYEVLRTYADKGISGKDITHRPALRELLQDAAEKKFHMVISWKINRLSRKLADAIKIVDVLEKNGITYRSYSEPFESDTPAGKMQFQMMALIGEFERSTIAQNVKMGMCAKARAGEWCGGAPPLGYDWVVMAGYENAVRKKSMLTENSKEADTVKLIFEEYASGKGYKAIVNCINKIGHKTKLGNEFSVAQIKPILTNPVYIGKVRYNVRRDWNEKRRHNINPEPIIVEGIHEAIISEELWNRVQLILKNKKGKPSRIYDGEYPLTGILKCPVCGAGMVISRSTNTLKDGTKKRVVYYTCGNWKNKGTAVCGSNSIRVEKANAVVYHELEKVFSNEKILKGVMEKINQEHIKKVKEAKQNLEKYKMQEQKLENRKVKAFEAFEDGIITSDELITRKNTTAREMQVIESQKQDSLLVIAEERGKDIPCEYVQAILSNFSKVLSSNIDRRLKKQLLHMVIAEITVDKRREIDTIKLRLTDELVAFLQNNGGTPPDGAPPFLCLKSMGISYLDMELAI